MAPTLSRPWSRRAVAAWITLIVLVWLLGVYLKQSWTAESCLPDDANVKAFYLQDEASRPENLLGICEMLARAIHDQYLHDRRTDGIPLGARPAMKDWRELSSLFKQSNILQAANIEQALQPAGYKLVPHAQPDTTFPEDDLGTIAEPEHERFRKERAYLNPDAPAVKPYKELDKTNRHRVQTQVRAWPGILAMVGFGVEKVKG